MYPAAGTDSIVAYAKGPKGDPGSVSPTDLSSAIAAVIGTADTAGNTLGKLEALIAGRATLDTLAAFSVSPTVPTLAPGNNSTKVTNSAYVRQELINYAVPLAGGTMTGALTLSADPTAALGAATKQYVDAFTQGISAKYSALCATTAALAANTYANGTAGVGATLTATGNGALAVDGQSPAAGQYVLVKNEVAAANNGLYQVTQAGDASHPYILTRAGDDNTAASMAGAFCFIEQGTVNNKTGWLCAQSGVTVGTTAISWTQFSGAGTYAAGTGLTLTGSTFSIGANAVTYALLQQVAASSLVGNATGSLANAAGITLGATLAFSGSALQTAAHTGDVTTAANSFATTIAANAVTYAKFQQVAASSLVGNATGLLANATGITLGATLTFSGSALQTGALTGDVTASANSFATSVAKIQGTAVSGTTGSANVVFSTTPVIATPTLTGSVAITSTSAGALTIATAGTTNPGFEVDMSTASQAAGVKITGAVTGGTVAIAAIDSGSNTNISLNGKGTGTIAIGNVSTGAVTITPALTLSAALTYGSVTLSNAVTGTGNMVLSASPTLTGTLTAAAGSFSSTLASTAHTITSASAAALAVGLAGATNPAFSVDASTASQAAGLNVKGAATGGTVAIVAIDSGSNTNISINAKGTGTINIGNVSTGNIVFTPPIIMTGASANSLAVGPNGVTNPTLNVDDSTALAATGLNIKSAAAAGGLALSVISSGTNENLTIDAKGSGTIALGGTSTGAITLTRATTISAALTYGSVTLSNSVTGTGSMVLSGGPTFTGTLTAATVSVSGNLTFSTSGDGIVGTATNDSANTGNVGEYVSAQVASGAAVSLTSGVAANITSISLTAGDWDVFGLVNLAGAASTTVTNAFASISTTSATLNNSVGNASQIWSNGNTIFAAATYDTMPALLTRITIASTTTVYLVVSEVFGTSTATAFGIIRARRVR